MYYVLLLFWLENNTDIKQYGPLVGPTMVCDPLVQ